MGMKYDSVTIGKCYSYVYPLYLEAGETHQSMYISASSSAPALLPKLSPLIEAVACFLPARFLRLLDRHPGETKLMVFGRAYDRLRFSLPDFTKVATPVIFLISAPRRIPCLYDFSGIYDVEHFIESLKKDVRIIQTLPTAWTDGKRRLKLKPLQVGLFLQAVGFDSSTRIYLAVGEIFGGERYLSPLRDLFPRLETRPLLAPPDEVVHVSSRNSPQGPAIDYMVCLLSDIFVPTYDGPGNLANHLIGQRLYYGFRTTLQPDREALSPLFRDFEKGRTGPSEFQNSVRQIMSQKRQGRLRTRVLPESFFTNPWPECFCKGTAEDDIHKCPSVTVDLVLTDELEGAAVTADKTPEYMAITDKNASD
ncbi:hypothetical protein R1sor_027580 [Riccia sorocarpa]|uniref:O-fucosyltransferase family protein n=1 Tax=Riccia sorocarpa TaxID=122646 RepID=A0ABD3GHH4_9MARC